MNNWKVTTLGKLGTVITGKTPSTKREDYFGSSVPFVTPKDMNGRKIISSTERYLTQAGVEAVKHSLLPANAVMVSCIGSDMGKVAIAGRECVTNQQINSIIVNEAVCPDYVYYDLSYRQVEIKSKSSGSAIPILNKGHFEQLQIGLPPLPEQKAIAHILGALDDKIELNRRMNETLEQIARAIFKSWFVDFEFPNSEGKPYKSNGGEMIDSELGEIPKSWKISSVGDEVHITKGVSYRSDELSTSDTALVTLKSVKRGGGYSPNGLKSYIGQFEPQQIVIPGELVVAQTDVTQAAEVIGKPALVLPDPFYKTLVASLDLLVIRPLADILTQHFFYLLFSTEDFQSHIYGHTNGTTVLHLDKIGVPSYLFVMPFEPLARKFSSQVQPIFRQIAANFEQSRTLAALRDTLLPKLLSGEIRIQDAENFLKERGL